MYQIVADFILHITEIRSHLLHINLDHHSQ